MAKIYIDNAKYMEFIDEITKQITEERFGEEMYEIKDSTDDSFGLREEAQNFYNERYDEVETILNRTLNIHSNVHLNTDN